MKVDNLIQQAFYDLVTFERATKDKLVCCIGGIEFSGDSKEELRQKAIKLLENEIERLRKEG